MAQAIARGTNDMTAKTRARAALVASALLAAASCAAQPASRAPQLETAVETRELFAHGAYRFLIEQRFVKELGETEPTPMEETLIVLKDGREIERREGWHWNAFEPAEDITGDDVPDIVLTDYSGGAHCCTTYYIFELGDRPLVHELYVADYVASFEQLDNGPALEIVTYDTNYAYWRASFVSSARARVVLRYRDGVYEAAPDLMRAPRPSPAELTRWATEARNGWWDMETLPRGSDRALDLNGLFVNSVVGLIYKGHADLVPAFVDLAWPAAKAGKQDFIEELMECRIRKSDYWPTVAAMNGLSADAPAGDCPAEDG